MFMGLERVQLASFSLNLDLIIDERLAEKVHHLRFTLCSVRDIAEID
jgi:hypothetical protein